MPDSSTGTAAGDLLVRLETALPERMWSDEATALFCAGWCYHRDEALRGLDLIVGGVRHGVDAARMPRPDVLARAATHPGAVPRCTS